MATIKTAVKGNVTVKKIIGVVTAEEMLNVARDFYAGRITKNLVVDRSEGSAVELQASDFELLAKFLTENAKARIGGKTAIVAPGDLGYGISRMAEIIAELAQTPVEIRAFRTLSEAAVWIGEGDLPIIDDE